MAVERNSNMELFRIIATFMIIIVHCNGWFLNDLSGVGSWWSGGSGFALLRTSVQAMTCIGVDCFILISGFFSIRPKGKSILNLFTLLVFFYVGCYFLNNALYGDGAFHPRTVLKQFLVFSRSNWFVQCYLFLMLLSPILNKFVENSSERQLGGLIIAYMACAFWFGCVRDAAWFAFNKGYSIGTMMLVYLVGRYIRLFGLKRLENIRSTMMFIVWLICTALMMLGYLYVPQKGLLWCYCSPIQIISASMLLILFSRIKLKSAVVNWFGKSCLAVYILHTTPPVIGWLVHADFAAFSLGSPCKWALTIVLYCIVLYCIAILLDKVRMLISRPLFVIYDKLERKIYERKPER